MVVVVVVRTWVVNDGSLAMPRHSHAPNYGGHVPVDMTPRPCACAQESGGGGGGGGVWCGVVWCGVVWCVCVRVCVEGGGEGAGVLVVAGGWVGGRVGVWREGREGGGKGGGGGLRSTFPSFRPSRETAELGERGGGGRGEMEMSRVKAEPRQRERGLGECEW